MKKITAKAPKYTHDDQFIKAVGKKIREVRIEKNLSQRQLGNLCNLEQSQIYRIEHGLINTSISHISIIAGVFEMLPMQLLDVAKKK